MTTETHGKLTIAALLCMIVAVLSLCFVFPRNDTHVHGWSKWESEGKPFINAIGGVVVPQHRVCTNCGYFQGEIH